MKKVKILVAFALLLAMCLPLVACGGTLTKDNLVGEWSHESDNVVAAFSFTESSFGFSFISVSGDDFSGFGVDIYKSGGGTYTIEGNTVNLKFSADSDKLGNQSLNYKNGKLCLGDYELTKD